MTTKRTPEQIVAAVKAAVMARDASEVITSGAGWQPVAIRLDKDRFALVRDVLDVEGVAPGKVNAAFHDAIVAARRIGVVTEEEVDRYYDWSRLESEKNEKRTARGKLERQAKELGLRLVPIELPYPSGKKRRR